MDDDFIETTLKERRSLQEALADFVAKYDRIPLGNERSGNGTNDRGPQGRDCVAQRCGQNRQMKVPECDTREVGGAGE